MGFCKENSVANIKYSCSGSTNHTCFGIPSSFIHSRVMCILIFTSRYHKFRVKCPVGMEIEVRPEIGGVDSRALLCYVPQKIPPRFANVVMTSRSSGQRYTMSEKAGKAIGCVQYFLNKAFLDLLEEGKVTEIKG